MHDYKIGLLNNRNNTMVCLFEVVKFSLYEQTLSSTPFVPYKKNCLNELLKELIGATGR